ncbi:tetratricopeptide repeat protein [Aurantimonas sp. Leaf443]|uniref:tetratricopeptide repeat protein n=1 Tax=Aurantimonas sp. Leaf443 TaxID=1736378 RepID=UPI0006FC8033|nr:tetratricopeptide repeat protein [Aurantimonas sp. Leaf443]KQT82157.1 hypothetical protein ASG48_16055 [Aurantimonas sp. Leaf443]
MSNDSFIREVNEEMRQDRVRAVWTRFGLWLLVAAILVVVATAAIVGWQSYRSAEADAAGDRYLAALDLAEAGQSAEAVTALQAIVAEDVGAYPDLARLRIAELEQAEGKLPEAVASFDAVANDGSVAQALRDLAAVRAAYILVDTGTRDDVLARVGRLNAEGEAMRYAAREALALSAYKAGAGEEARTLLQGLLDDQGTPNGISTRARVVLDVIAGAAPAPAPATPATPAAAAAAPAETPAAPAAPAPGTN